MWIAQQKENLHFGVFWWHNTRFEKFFSALWIPRKQCFEFKGHRTTTTKSRNSPEVSHDAYWFVNRVNRQANKPNETKKQKTQTESSSSCAMITQSAESGCDTKSFGAVHLRVRVKAPARMRLQGILSLPTSSWLPRTENLLCAAFPALDHLYLL